MEETPRQQLRWKCLVSLARRGVITTRKAAEETRLVFSSSVGKKFLRQHWEPKGGDVTVYWYFFNIYYLMQESICS